MRITLPAIVALLATATVANPLPPKEMVRLTVWFQPDARSDQRDYVVAATIEAGGIFSSAFTLEPYHQPGFEVDMYEKEGMNVIRNASNDVRAPIAMQVNGGKEVFGDFCPHILCP